MNTIKQHQQNAVWRLSGYDRFDGEWYTIPGTFESEDDAVVAALREADKTTTSVSGGGAGAGGATRRASIDDEFNFIYVIRPDGTAFLVHRDLLS